MSTSSISYFLRNHHGHDGSWLTYGITFAAVLVVLLPIIGYACMRYRMSRTRGNIPHIVAGVPLPPQIVERYMPESREQGHHVNVQIDTSYESYSEELKNTGGSTIFLSACTICLGHYKESDKLRALPDCGHIFHQACVDPWLKSHSFCPICRKPSAQAPQSSAFNVGESAFHVV